MNEGATSEVAKPIGYYNIYIYYIMQAEQNDPSYGIGAPQIKQSAFSSIRILYAWPSLHLYVPSSQYAWPYTLPRMEYAFNRLNRLNNNTPAYSQSQYALPILQTITARIHTRQPRKALYA